MILMALNSDIQYLIGDKVLNGVKLRCQIFNDVNIYLVIKI